MSWKNLISLALFALFSISCRKNNELSNSLYEYIKKDIKSDELADSDFTIPLENIGEPKSYPISERVAIRRTIIEDDSLSGQISLSNPLIYRYWTMRNKSDLLIEFFNRKERTCPKTIILTRLNLGKAAIIRWKSSFGAWQINSNTELVYTSLNTNSIKKLFPDFNGYIVNEKFSKITIDYYLPEKDSISDRISESSLDFYDHIVLEK